MKAFEFATRLTPDGHLDVPPELAGSLPTDRPIRAIVLVDEPKDDAERQAWAEATAAHFLAGYDDIDAVYDEP